MEGVGTEEYDPKKRFEQYLREKEGEPIDPKIAAAGKRELELGEKGDYAVYNDEPDREKLIASYPKGRLGHDETSGESEEGAEQEDFTTKLSKFEEGGDRALSIAELKTAKSIILDFLEKGPDPFSLSFEEGKFVKKEMPYRVALVTDILSSKYNIQGVAIQDLPKVIDELIEKQK